MTRPIDADALIDTLYEHEFSSYIDKGAVSTLINDEPTVDAVPVDMIKDRINDLKKMLIDTDDDNVDLIWNLRAEIGTLHGLIEMWEERKEE